MWIETTSKDFYVITFRIEHFNHIPQFSDGGQRIDTAENIIRRIVAKTDLNYDKRIILLEQVIEECEDAGNHLASLWEEIKEQHKAGTLDSPEFREYLEYQDIPGLFGEESHCPVYFKLPFYEDLPLYWAVKEWPFRTPELHRELVTFIETVQRGLNLIRDNELSKAILGTPKSAPAQVQEPQVKFSTIQWLGLAEDFHHLCDHLEKVLWLAPQSHDMLSRFFFDIEGNPMSTTENVTPQLERVKWTGSTIDFYRLSWYLDDKALLAEKHLQKFARLFLDQNGKPMKEDSSAQKSRDSDYAKKFDPKVKDFIDRILENKRK